MRTLALFVALLSIAAYAQTLYFGFVWDDVAVVRFNPNIRSLPAAFRTFTHRALTSETDAGFDPSQNLPTRNYRPMRNLLHAFVWAVAGDTPLFYHALNVLGHATVGVLLLFLLLKLTNGDRIAATVGACFFALHPMTTETVCWVKIVEDIAAAICLLGAVLVWLGDKPRKQTLRVGLVCFMFAVGVLCKISVLFLPFLMVAWAVFPAESRTHAVRRALWAAGLLGGIGVGLLLLRHQVLGRTAQSGFITGDALTTWLSMGRVFLRYMRLQFVPVGLLVDYYRFPRATSISSPDAVVFFLSFLVAAGLLLFLTWKHRLHWGAFWFFAAMLPVANIVPMEQLGAERFLYIPTMGSAILISQIWNRWGSDWKVSRPILILIACFAVYTPIRSRVWRNERSLWKEAVKEYPDNPRALKNLAKAYLAEENGAAAIPFLRKLNEIAPTEETILLAGYAQGLVGDQKLAIRLLKAVGKGHIVLRDLAVTEFVRGNLGRSLVYAREAHNIQPENQDYKQLVEQIRQHQSSPDEQLTP